MKKMSWNCKFHVFTIIQPTYNCKFTNLQCSGIKIMKQCSDINCMKSVCIRSWSGPILHHILNAYRDFCKSPYSDQLQEKICTRKKLRTWTLSTQWSGFVVHKLKFFVCLHLEISSFLWFRRCFPWCSMINSFLFKHK